MKFESSVTAVSWIPAEAVKGFLGVPFEMGLAHYDDALPETLDNLDDWHRKDLFREANELKGWIEVVDGKIVGHGQEGGGRIGVTRIKLGPKTVSVKAKGGEPHLSGDAKKLETLTSALTEDIKWLNDAHLTKADVAFAREALDSVSELLKALKSNRKEKKDKNSE